MAASDLEIVQSILAGNQQAFGLLAQRYGQRLLSFLQGRAQLSCEEAEDIVQDVWATLIEHDYAALRSFQGRSSLYTYLCAIALRRVYRLRKRSVPTVDPPEDTPVAEPAIDTREHQITAAQVREALAALPEPFRVALLLHHFGGLEYHEIAGILGIPANTVATRICRAKRRLRELLES